jgi:hypothetical protein
MADLNALVVFAEVVEAKSFSEAARRSFRDRAGQKLAYVYCGEEPRRRAQAAFRS